MYVFGGEADGETSTLRKEGKAVVTGRDQEVPNVKRLQCPGLERGRKTTEWLSGDRGVRRRARKATRNAREPRSRSRATRRSERLRRMASGLRQREPQTRH